LAQNETSARLSLRVPVHSLGISQIIAYGLMFYVFALLKTPLAINAGVEVSQILAGLTGCLLIQAMVAPGVGALVDRLGALWVMARGFLYLDRSLHDSHRRGFCHDHV
jgi:hypothetical protein